jgi:dedicator of cytokinesis protein 3
MRSPTGSWIAVASGRSQIASTTPDDHQINGTRVMSPVPGAKPTHKKRLSLAFLTKGSLMGEPEKEREAKADTQPAHEHDDSPTTTPRCSASRDTSRNRLNLSFLNTAPVTPISPGPEALPAFHPSRNASQSNLSHTSAQRDASVGRPETSKSMKSGKSETSKKGSVKKRLSFMNISKKSSKSSVRGRAHDTLMEE